MSTRGERVAHPSGGLAIYTGHKFELLEEMSMTDFSYAVTLLSREELRAQCDRITEASKSLAIKGKYDEARELAIAADHLEAHLSTKRR